MKETIRKSFQTHIELASRCLGELTEHISAAAEMSIASLKAGNKIIFFGNGGSAADAQHLAAELVGRFTRERKAIAAIACTTDTSILTAIGNDYGYDRVFVRQIEALARPGDILVGISTSGNSQNVLLALEQGKKIGCKTIGLLGKDGGKIKDAVDIPLLVASSETARVQEMHILVGHILCDLIEEALSDS